MSDCPQCGMRDDDWFLCRRANCAVSFGTLTEREVNIFKAVTEPLNAEIAGLRQRLEALPRYSSANIKLFMDGTPLKPSLNGQGQWVRFDDVSAAIRAAKE